MYAQIAGGTPWDTEVLTELELAAMLDDQPGALETARSYLAQLDDMRLPADLRPRPHGSASRPSAWLGRRLVPGPTSCATGPRVSSARGTAGLTDEWRPTYHGVQLALAEAYAARYAEEPAVAQFRAATVLAEPFGAYFALEPRLNLADELLAHGGRDEGRELLVECWSTAHDMGAHDLERRALRLATRTRVPLPQSASTRGTVEPADAARTRGPRPPRHRRHQQDDRDRPCSSPRRPRACTCRTCSPSSASPTAARPPPWPEIWSADRHACAKPS